ncbi:hypothetical protein [Sphingobacterium spiritivorum]|uniref:hypothetical protein n=1 Tax=Sphingobacterium spiritivorum TaxID=258 RepID=UPI00191B7B56|nr:hypothetical protein [Sphingobacterium spiritivorum]QQT26831.1 hypothetical protein I6J02_02905 [Sphingobacterium spiritivorum]
MRNTPHQQLPSNIVAFITAPSVQVDHIQEIQTIYNVDLRITCDIYETVGDQYTNESSVAAFCGIASPAYLAELKGGVQC